MTLLTVVAAFAIFTITIAFLLVVYMLVKILRVYVELPSLDVKNQASDFEAYDGTVPLENFVPKKGVKIKRTTFVEQRDGKGNVVGIKEVEDGEGQ